MIGGSGLYQLFDDRASTVLEVETAFGHVALTRGTIGGKEAVFLPRRGADHSVPPHLIPARAMVWALASIGVRVLISTAAVGSLNPDMAIGTIAVADRSSIARMGAPTRTSTGPRYATYPFADPFGSRARQLALDACPELVDGATVLVIQGPRFSTRAESRINRAAAHRPRQHDPLSRSRTRRGAGHRHDRALRRHRRRQRRERGGCRHGGDRLRPPRRGAATSDLRDRADRGIRAPRLFISGADRPRSHRRGADMGAA